MKKIEQEKNRPAANLPYQNINRPFRCQYLIPLDGIEIRADKNGVLFISAKGGSVDNLVAGDNINLDRRDDGTTVISSLNTEREIYGGENVVVSVDPETGAAVISAYDDGTLDEHYKGIFGSTEDLIAAVTDPEQGDYGLVKDVVITDGETSWNGRYKLCFYDSGMWKVVDQMLTFTNNPELLKRCWSVGGASPVIYLSEVAGTGDFWSLLNIPIVATPVATVEGNTVTVTCETEGAEIWYSTDGSMPHVNGTKYTGPITAAEATTYRFVGIKNGMINSLEAVASADYSVQAPNINLDWTNGEITMTNPNGSGDIYYTTDNTEPTNASMKYTGPFIITNPTTFKLAVISGSNMSEIVTRHYSKVAVSSLTIRQNYIYGTISALFSSMMDGVEFRHTLDGSTPDYSSAEGSETPTINYYDGPLTIKCIGFAEGYIPSDVKSKTVGADKPVSPPIYFDGSTNTVTLVDEIIGSYGYINGLFGHVTFINNPRHSRIFYTLDGTTPSKDNGVQFTGPFQINGNTTVKAVIFAFNEYYSDVTTLEISPVAAPVISLDSDTALITIAGQGNIYYTTDGSTPTAESTLYTGPINGEIAPLTGSLAVKAISVVNGQASGVAEATYRRLQWRGTAPYDVNFNAGIISCGHRQEEDGATVYYRVYSVYDEEGRPIGPTGPFIPYTEPIEIPLYDSRNPRAIEWKQTKPGYIPYTYGTSTFGYQEPDEPKITLDETTDKATIELDGNTADIPLQTNNNVPTMGARIYYTTDGTTPSSDNGTLYDGVSEIPIPVGDTLKAVTKCYGEYESEVSDLARVPEISVDSETGLMTIVNPYSSETRYTLDGSTPTQYSTLYSEPVDISVNIYQHHQTQTLTIKAAAFEENTAIAVAELSMPVVQASAIGLSYYGGYEYNNIDVNVYASGVQDIDAIKATWFRTGGDIDPDTGYIDEWTESGPQTYLSGVFDSITVFGHQNKVVYKVKLSQDGHIPVMGDPFEVGFDKPDAPAVSYNDTEMTATFSRTGNAQFISLQYDNANPQIGCRIYYTLDGSTPTDQSTLWVGNAVQCQVGDLIKAICVCYGQYASEVTTEEIPVDYMYFESVEPNSTVKMISGLETAPNLEYSTDGTTWQEWEHTTAEGVHTFDTITLRAVGDRVYLRGVNPAGFIDHNNETYSRFSMTGKIAAGGNAQSLVDGDTPTLVAKTMPYFSDYKMTLQRSDVLTQAPALPATTMVYACYSSMFAGCTGLSQAPALPATTLAYGCYVEMFYGCTGLTQAPALPATTLEPGCYFIMFGGCTGLTQAPALPATTLEPGCYFIMFSGCTFNMSDDGTTFNFQCDATLPQTVDGTPYTTPAELAEWMGNTNGFTNP